MSASRSTRTSGNEKGALNSGCVTSTRWRRCSWSSTSRCGCSTRSCRSSATNTTPNKAAELRRVLERRCAGEPRRPGPDYRPRPLQQVDEHGHVVSKIAGSRASGRGCPCRPGGRPDAEGGRGSVGSGGVPVGVQQPGRPDADQEQPRPSRSVHGTWTYEILSAAVPTSRRGDLAYVRQSSSGARSPMHDSSIRRWSSRRSPARRRRATRSSRT